MVKYMKNTSNDKLNIHHTETVMSSKGSKRRQRRINTHEEEQEKKIVVEETVEQSDDNKSNISTDTDKLEKDAIQKEENGEVEQPNAVMKEPEAAIQNGNETNSVNENAEAKTNSDETTNGQTENEISNSQSTDDSDSQKLVTEDTGSDLEPLVLDSEDTELHFPSETGSDRSSEIDKSPILIRPKTRRSQTRNLPTPKTPKTLDFNGDADCKNEVRVNITRLPLAPELIVTPPTDVEDKTDSTENMSLDSTLHDKPDELTEEYDEADEDLANASVFVNYTGNETTRNLDITTTSALDDGPSVPSFLETTKDLSYGETLRCISGRKGLRAHFDSSYRPRMYKSTVDITSNDMADGIKKFVPMTPAPSSGVKRRLSRDSPEDFKRVKTDGDSHGLMSYIASPFKSKVGRTEIPSSTPKLTSFKYTPHQGSTIIDEVSKIDLELHEKTNTEPKKWCSIM